MKDTNNTAGQLADTIAGHVEKTWISRCIHPGTDDTTAAKIAQIANANRRAFWDLVAPQVLAHYIGAYAEALDVQPPLNLPLPRLARAVVRA